MTPEAIDPNKVIRGYVENEGAVEWKHRELADELYKWGDIFRFYFFSLRRNEATSYLNLWLPSPLCELRHLPPIVQKRIP
ncbi:MAG: hypothetical protein M1358_25745 [Chloroflexi bacterium]|nr:hypothetical protein [Chloroflexota bacterium]